MNSSNFGNQRIFTPDSVHSLGSPCSPGLTVRAASVQHGDLEIMTIGLFDIVNAIYFSARYCNLMPAKPPNTYSTTVPSPLTAIRKDEFSLHAL